MSLDDRWFKPINSLAAVFAIFLVVVLAPFGGNAQPAVADVRNVDPQLVNYWHPPLGPQGKAPVQWSEIERSLAPEACGQCHSDKFEEWRTSLHAKAFSPGLVGQLLTFDAGQTSSCMKCHAPLAEQRQAFEAARNRGEAHLTASQGLASTGNSCGGCHVRDHRRYGPSQRATGATGQSDAAGAHGGVYRSTYFERSEFCSTCHQFPPDYAVNGKPLQNTYAEWRSSPQAAEGITCQGCHMPGRQHLWRGIHDPETTAAGLTARFFPDAQGARFQLTNSGVGHAFPTYVTPKVVMRAVALDSTGRPRLDHRVSHVIQRVVAYAAGRWVERSDSRLLPGQSASLFLPWNGDDRIRMWLEVYPDDYYDHQVYDQLLGGLPAGGSSARLIAEADVRAGASRYRLFETEFSRP